MHGGDCGILGILGYVYSVVSRMRLYIATMYNSPHKFGGACHLDEM